VTPSYFRTARHGWAVPLLYRLLYPHADMILSPARAIIDEFKEMLSIREDRYALLPNPVDTGKTRESPPAPRANRTTVQFVCAGRLHHQKGFDRLIAALAAAPPAFPWRLHILGEGGEKDALQSLIARHGLEDRIALKGFNPRPWAEIAGADAFLLPSRFEGLPNVVLEALSTGTRVIAMKDAGGVAEVAALASPGAVRVTDTMERFMEEVRGVTAAPVDTLKPSLLPEAFYPEAVLSRFSDLLDRVSTNQR